MKKKLFINCNLSESWRDLYQFYIRIENWIKIDWCKNKKNHWRIKKSLDK